MLTSVTSLRNLVRPGAGGKGKKKKKKKKGHGLPSIQGLAFKEQQQNQVSKSLA